jgi:uncharacterized Tic20 family protein
MSEQNPFDALTDGPAGGGGTSKPLDSNEKMLATFSHLGSVIGGFVLPLVLYLTQKDKSKFVEEHAKEALNFQISLIIAYVVGGILAIIIIGFFVIIAAALCGLIFGIMGALKANEGQPYKYPFNIRFIK